MKVKIGDQIIDPNVQPVAIIFENDNQRKWIANQILNMPDHPRKKRAYIQAPAGTTHEALDKFIGEALK